MLREENTSPRPSPQRGEGVANQKPKSCGIRPDWRMMERVVPMGSSFFGCGTMANASDGVLVFGVAAALGDEKETVVLEHPNDFGGAEPFRHSPSPGRC